MGSATVSESQDSLFVQPDAATLLQRESIAEPDVTSAEPLSVGAQLAATRVRRGVSLQQAADALRVDVDVIEALEAEQFERLGPPVYSRGHLRRYADFLGEPLAPLQASYEAAQIEPLSGRLRGRVQRVVVKPARPAVLSWPVALGLGVGVLALIVWWALRSQPALSF